MIRQTSNYLLWSFVPDHGWFVVDRTRSETVDAATGRVTTALDLAGLETQRDARTATARKNERRHWFTITPEDVDLHADWFGTRKGQRS